MLQRFFEENPEYFLPCPARGRMRTRRGRSSRSARRPDWPWDGKWTIRFVDADGAIAGAGRRRVEPPAPGVWHVGLFIVATRLHGSGRASDAFDALEGWIRDGGAQWLRLNVAVGNTRAERFWERTGFAEVRRREGVRTAGRTTRCGSC